MRIDPLKLKLYLVTDGSISRRPLIDAVAEAVAGGVTMVQLREKRQSPRERIELGKALKSVLAPHQVPLIVNDSVELAQAIASDGVHLGQRDTSPRIAREMLGNQAIIGVSIENTNQLGGVPWKSVDYIAASPVFTTMTKLDIAQPLGLQGLRQLVARSTVPVIGIGGITIENAHSVIEAGANGVAVVSAILRSEDPKLAAMEIRSTIDDARISALSPQFPRVLTIAGSDSGGGAGIQADLKTILALGAYGSSVVTALTAQNTLGVQGVFPIPPTFIAQQIHSVVSDIGASIIKLGMLHSEEVIESVMEALESYPQIPIVIDPVMCAKDGSPLLAPAAIHLLRERVLPRGALVTPNIPEARLLLDRDIRNVDEMQSAAKDLSRLCPNALLKGGHLDADSCTDVLVTHEGESLILAGRRIQTPNTHGTGCTLSAAIATLIARGRSLQEAVGEARNYLYGAIESGARFAFQGHGPVDHAWRMR